jgi:hypothetical protein
MLPKNNLFAHSRDSTGLKKNTLSSVLIKGGFPLGELRGNIATKKLSRGNQKILSQRNRGEIIKLLLIQHIYCALIGYQ